MPSDVRGPVAESNRCGSYLFFFLSFYFFTNESKDQPIFATGARSLHHPNWLIRSTRTFFRLSLERWTENKVRLRFLFVLPLASLCKPFRAQSILCFFILCRASRRLRSSCEASDAAEFSSASCVATAFGLVPLHDHHLDGLSALA